MDTVSNDPIFEKLVEDFGAIEKDPNKNVDVEEEVKEDEKVEEEEVEEEVKEANDDRVQELWYGIMQDDYEVISKLGSRAELGSYLRDVGETVSSDVLNLLWNTLKRGEKDESKVSEDQEVKEESTTKTEDDEVIEQEVKE